MAQPPSRRHRADIVRTAIGVAGREEECRGTEVQNSWRNCFVSHLGESLWN